MYEISKSSVRFLEFHNVHTHEELLKLYNYQVPKSGEKVTLKDMSGREYEKTVQDGAISVVTSFDVEFRRDFTSFER